MDFPSSSINSGWLYFQVAKFPFKSNMSFVVIVPNQYTWNNSYVLENLSYEQLCKLFPKEVPTTVKIPKIKLDYQLELNKVLSQMGKASNKTCRVSEADQSIWHLFTDTKNCHPCF